MSKTLEQRMYYFTPFDILRSRTNQISDIRFCEGFAQNNFKVHLIAPYVYRSDNVKKSQILSTYGVEVAYKVTYLPIPFLRNVDNKLKLGLVILQDLIAFLCIAFSSLFSRKSNRVVISRSMPILYPMLRLRKAFKLPIQIYCWIHEIKEQKAYEYVYHHADYILTTNSAIKEDVISFYGIEEKRVGVTLNPITERQVSYAMSKAEAREKIGIDLEPLIVYTGKLSKRQLEASYILQAAKALPDYYFLLTGGKADVVQFYKDWCAKHKVGNVTFTGYLHDYRKLQDYQQAADVLISYYTRKNHDVRYNLPQKIVEYMLTGSPIVTPNFEATRDLLNEGNAIFVEEENVESLVEGIRKAVERKEYAKQIGDRARAVAKETTFKKIIQNLLIAISNCSPKNTID